MAENTFEVDYELNTQEARQELEALRKQLNGISADFNQALKVNEAGVKKLKSALKEITDLYKDGTLAQQARAQSRADTIERGFYGRVGQSSGVNGRSADANNINRAVAQSLISDIRNSTEAVKASVKDAIVKQTVSLLKTTEEAINARIRSAEYAATQQVANSSDRLLSAKSRLADQRRADTIYAGENGSAALASRKRLEQLNYNGGSDLMGIQGRVMLNYAAVGGLFSSIKSAGSGIVELDKELHQFQAISTATNSEMVAFKQNLLNVAQAVPYSTVEIAKAATELAQAGLSTKQVTESLGSIAQFATATGSSLTQAVDVVTSTLTAFNLETSRTGDVANIFTAALNLSKLSVDKLQTSLNYIGPTAEAMGISLEETTSILGALSQSGVKASTMGTGFRALLTDLQDPSKKLTATLRAAGLSVDDINVKTKGFLPVIETLKKAGFGAAEAYESLETRSAAAYLALANNTELAKDMQRSFTLSAAAVEANAIQMTSLSNTAQTLQNTLGASTFTAFEPLLAVFQKVMVGATQIVSWLNQFPGLLQGIGSVAGVLATVLGVSLFGNLIKSLGLMIPLVSTFSAAFALTSTVVAGATVELGFFSRALAGLMAVLASNWIGLLVAGVVLATGAFFAWKGRADELTTSIDALESKVNDLKGAADATESKIGSLDTAIQGLIDRRDELNKDGFLRQAKIDELRTQFNELGLSIKDDTMSVTDLIRELNDLRSTSSRVRAAELAEAAETRRAEIDKLKEQRDRLTNRQGPQANYLREQADLANGGVGGAVEASSNNYLIDAISKKFGTNIGSALRISLGDLSQVHDARQALSISKYVNEQITVAQRKGDPDGNLGFLTTLKETLDPIVANLTKTAAATADLTVILRNEANAGVQGSKSYAALTERAQNIQTGFNDRIAGISSGGMNDEQKIAAYASVRKWLETVRDKSVQAFKDDFAKESASDPNLAGLDGSAVSSGIDQALAALQLKLNEASQKAITSQTKYVTKEVKKAETNQNKELARWQRQISGARNNEAFEAAKKGYEDLRAATTKQIVDFYDELIRLANLNKDTDAVEKLQDERSDFLERAAAETAEQQRANDAKALDLQKESLQRQKEAVQDSAKALREKIEAATAELKKTPPSDAMNALVTKIKELTAQLGGELNKIGNIDVQLEGIDLNEPVSKAMAGSAQSAIKHFMERGLSKAGAAAIASNLSVESEFNPDAVGDHGSAHGVAQWRGTRWNELRSEAIKRGTASNDIGTQYDFVLKELMRDYPDLFARLKAGDEDPQTLSKAFMDQFERPNKDPSVNHVGKRMSRAQAFLSGTDTAGDVEVKKIADDTDKQVKENINKGIEAQADAAITNLKSRIGNLKTQVRFTDDAKSLTDLQKQIHDAHDQLLDQEIKKFDAENATLKDENPGDYANKLKELKAGLRENLNSDLQKVMEEYYKAADEELNKPVDRAKAALDIAQQPDMASKYTQADIQKLQQNVVDREREAAANRVLLIEKEIAEVRRMAAEAEANNPDGSRDTEILQLKTMENDLLKKNNELKETNNLLDAAKANQGPSVSSAIQSATNAWAQQNGIIDANNQMIPLAKQFETTWGEVLDGLSSGFSQFFTNIASGTMSAGEAFKQLGQTILQMFIQIIAKALANQIIMSLFGGGDSKTGSSGIFGDFGKMLLGVVGGKANGGMNRAANGTKVSPFRDGGNYKLMPGEMVLRQSAVSMIGEDKLTQMNNLGNRQISEGQLAGRVANDNQQQGSGVVNVWIVSPDQQPQMGPNDVVAHVADNIQRRGTLKKLIQQVQMGG